MRLDEVLRGRKSKSHQCLLTANACKREHPPWLVRSCCRWPLCWRHCKEKKEEHESKTLEKQGKMTCGN
jgi:hypothetical protein